ncbi:MAG TPA: hypothetical protein VM778_13020 [Gemmatimonadota bacterium]|nr:hypothetical protein [Gemmatimonadota bacterium]
MVIGPKGWVAAALCVLWACGGSYSSPEGAVQTWLDALQAGDTAAVRESFTGRTQELVAEIESLSREAEPASGHPAITVEDWCTAFCGATVEGSTLHGDSATVRIRLDDDLNEIPVLREEAGWKIDLWARLHPAVQMLRLAVRQASAGPAPIDAPAPADTAAFPDDTAGP